MLVNSDPESVFDIKDIEWFQAMLNWKDDFYAGQVVNAAAPNDNNVIDAIWCVMLMTNAFDLEGKINL